MQKAVGEIGMGVAPPKTLTTVFPILIALSFCHLLNDMMQSMISALYPMLKQSYGLNFTQIGLITLMFQITASLLQPAVGMATDKKPMPFSLSVGMGATFAGLLLLSVASSYGMILAAAMLVGVGSSVFHPESSRVARAASGGRYGMAQSLFQVGGNAGSAIGPLLAALVVLPRGQGAVAFVSAAALLGMFILGNVGVWYKNNLALVAPKGRARAAGGIELSRGRIVFAIAISSW